MKQLSAVELAQWLANSQTPEAPSLLDVREPWEIELAQLPGSLCIPMGQIPARVGEVPNESAVVCICHHGVRSMRVAHFLEQSGFESVYNLQGGIDSWAREVDLQCAIY